MNNPVTMTRNQAAEIVMQFELEELNWKQYEIYDHAVAVKPDGGCYIYENCSHYPNIMSAMESLCNNNLRLYENGYKLYSGIVNNIDSNAYGYDEYFTKEYIDQKRLALPLYPLWIKLSKQGKVPIKCENCYATSWISVHDINDLDNIKHQCHNCEAYCNISFE